MEARRQRFRNAKASFRVGQPERISMEKMQFAKAAEHNFSTGIYRVVKVIETRQRIVYKLEDLNRTPIDGHFYREELTPVRITDRTAYEIDKILDKTVKRALGNTFSAGEVIVRIPTLWFLQLT